MRRTYSRGAKGAVILAFTAPVAATGLLALGLAFGSASERVGGGLAPLGLMSFESRATTPSADDAAAPAMPATPDATAPAEGVAAVAAGSLHDQATRAAEQRAEQPADRPVTDQAEARPDLQSTAPAADALEPAAEQTRPSFDGRPLRPVRELEMTVTAYSPDERSCGEWADGWTASGYSVWTNGMNLVAADTSLLPIGTVVSIPGYNNGEPVQVLDRGGAIKGHRLDLLYPTHERALQWGVQRLPVTVWEYAD